MRRLHQWTYSSTFAHPAADRCASAWSARSALECRPGGCCRARRSPRRARSRCSSACRAGRSSRRTRSSSPRAISAPARVRRRSSPHALGWATLPSRDRVAAATARRPRRATTSATACRTSRRSRARRGWPPARARCARCPTRASATATRAARSSCARRSPRTSGALAGSSPTRSGCSSAAGRGSRSGSSGACWASAARGVSRSRIRAGRRSRRPFATPASNPCRYPSTSDGLRVDELATLDVDAVVLTPAHQCPTGAVLSPARRAALLEWAQRPRRARRRGRLRRRVPLRPRAGRRAAGHGARSRRLCGLRQQDARAGIAARMAATARASSPSPPRRTSRAPIAASRWRTSSSSPSSSRAASSTATCAARAGATARAATRSSMPWPPSYRGRGSRGSRRGCTRSSVCPRAPTRPRRCARLPSAAWRSTASPPFAAPPGHRRARGRGRGGEGRAALVLGYGNLTEQAIARGIAELARAMR